MAADPEKTVVFDGTSRRGRSGFNLDDWGVAEAESRVLAWVIDGASPIIFQKKDAFLFRKYLHACAALSSSISHCFFHLGSKQLFSSVSDFCRSKEPELFGLDGPAIRRPIFSTCSIVIDLQQDEIIGEVVIYGDCAVLVVGENRMSVFEARKLEVLKKFLDKLFLCAMVAFPIGIARYFKLTAFWIIRHCQIRFGFWRIFCVSPFWNPDSVYEIRLDRGDTVLLLSDGGYWFFKDKSFDEVFKLSEKTPDQICSLIRAAEQENRGFGQYDDLTVVKINI